GRSILKAMENTAYFRFTREVHTVEEFDELLQSGKVLFGVEIPRGFERAVRRGDRPALLVAADATDPVAASSALATLGPIVQTALAHDRIAGEAANPPFEIRAHARYNPAGSSSMNIVPGLVGIILTMTMLIFTALSVTREIERGTIENLLSMPLWAQYISEALPLTHFIRIVRAIMLKGSTLENLRYDTGAMVVLTLLVMVIAVTRFRRTLD